MEAQSVVMFGPPGCGKGTQSEFIFERWKELGLKYMKAGTGDGFRKLTKEGGFVAELVKQIMSEGGLIPDFLPVAFFTNILIGLAPETSFLADGFPRTVKQAEHFHEMIKFFNRRSVKIIHLLVPEDECIKRNLGRGREDDTEESLRFRFQEYKEKTSPVAHFFFLKSVVLQEERIYQIHDVNAIRSKEEVRDEIFGILGI